MIQAVKERVTIQPGGRIELERPDLPTGAEAEVIVMVEVPEGDESVSPGVASAGQELVRAGQLPGYRDLLQVPSADEADRWSWECSAKPDGPGHGESRADIPG